MVFVRGVTHCAHKTIVVHFLRVLLTTRSLVIALLALAEANISSAVAALILACLLVLASQYLVTQFRALGKGLMLHEVLHKHEPGKV